MDSGLTQALAELQSQQARIKISLPDSPSYNDLIATYVVSPARPSAVARPKTAENVQAIVRTCLAYDVDFNIRTGGHSPVGRTLVDGALLVDMRDIAYVEVGEDRATARVGGGVQTAGLLEQLGGHGLVAACGTIGTVGYVGWSANGGYGPFSALLGLGCDQIVGAKLVNAKGELVEANDELLKGIRGAGHIFGVVVELTIRTYPLKEMLVSTTLFESTDMAAAWTRLTEGLQSLSAPPALYIQLFASPFPGLGNALGLIATWVSDDHAEGQQWIDRAAALGGTAVMNVAEAKSPARYAEDNEKLVAWGVHGRSYTLNLRTWTARSVEVLARGSATVPAPGAMISVHNLRSPKLNGESVFGARENHLMVEIVSTASGPALKEEVNAWGQRVLRELKEADPDNVLDSAYISLLDHRDADLQKLYGGHLDTVVALKRKYDPDNVFKHSSPKVLE